ncbi:MAG: isochorismatase family protein [Thiotrichales bacterium]
MTPLCRADDCLVICIDVQERLADSMPEPSTTRTLENLVRILQSANLLEIPVLYTEQLPGALGGTVEIVRAAMPDTAQRFEKTAFSCCGNASILESVRKSHKRQVILVGMEAHVAVMQSALELLEHGVEVYVIDDAVCSRRLAHWKSALMRLRQAGAVVSITESLLFEWLRSSSHEHFNKVSWFLR